MQRSEGTGSFMKDNWGYVSKHWRSSQKYEIWNKGTNPRWREDILLSQLTDGTSDVVPTVRWAGDWGGTDPTPNPRHSETRETAARRSSPEPPSRPGNHPHTTLHYDRDIGHQDALYTMLMHFTGKTPFSFLLGFIIWSETVYRCGWKPGLNNSAWQFWICIIYLVFLKRLCCVSCGIM